MDRMSRNQFLKSLAAMGILPAIISARKVPRISFSTLGCPDWSLQEIVRFASAHHYKGIELRGLRREMDLWKSEYFSSPKAIASSLKMFADNDLDIVALGSSCELHFSDAGKNREQMENARRFAHLAAELRCPFVRVFPNKLPPERDRNETLDLIAQRLDSLGNDVEGSGVKILLETHGDLVLSGDVARVMDKLSSPNAGLIWDVSNMWFATKEPPTLVYNTLKKYIFHTHIKDRALVNGKERSVLLGRGQVPIFEAVDLLVQDHYKGFLSFEWEKLWEPDIEAPEIALADYPLAIQKHLHS